MRTLLPAVLSAAEVEASFSVMGLDTQLIEDGTYYVVERDGRIAGCGGWSRRATLFGGDHSAGRDAACWIPRPTPRACGRCIPIRISRGRVSGRLILGLWKRRRRLKALYARSSAPLCPACRFTRRMAIARSSSFVLKRHRACAFRSSEWARRSADMLRARALDIVPGVRLWSGGLDANEQKSLVEEVLRRAQDAPLLSPAHAALGETVFRRGDEFRLVGMGFRRSGYRYETRHPFTRTRMAGNARTAVGTVAGHDGISRRSPNAASSIFTATAHAWARTRIATKRRSMRRSCPCRWATTRCSASAAQRAKGPPQASSSSSGDVLVFGGPARLAFHGIDRIVSGSSRLVPGGGRINLTLRRVSRGWKQKKTPDQGADRASRAPLRAGTGRG